jgi:hypothetical protein
MPSHASQGGALLAVMAGVGVLTGALIGALFGAFRGGLTGPDIERRTTPHQGMRQSARNVGWFTVIGGLTLGLSWRLLNLFLSWLMASAAHRNCLASLARGKSLF